MVNNPNLERRVVCAANRNSDTIILGARHWDKCMRKHALLLDTDFISFGWEQGFINSWGEFLTREEAWIVARHNNQIIRLVGNQRSLNDIDNELYSENLY